MRTLGGREDAACSDGFNDGPFGARKLRSKGKQLTIEQQVLKNGNEPIFILLKEHERKPGTPLPFGEINTRLSRLCTLTKVKRISVHGLRHTCATLMLAGDTSPNVVQKRLGHSKVLMALDLYAHVLPSMERDARRVSLCACTANKTG